MVLLSQSISRATTFPVALQIVLPFAIFTWTVLTLPSLSLFSPKLLLSALATLATDPLGVFDLTECRESVDGGG